MNKIISKAHVPDKKVHPRCNQVDFKSLIESKNEFKKQFIAFGKLGAYNERDVK
jgi:hypothetical protein